MCAILNYNFKFTNQYLTCVMTIECLGKMPSRLKLSIVLWSNNLVKRFHPQPMCYLVHINSYKLCPYLFITIKRDIVILVL